MSSAAVLKSELSTLVGPLGPHIMQFPIYIRPTVKAYAVLSTFLLHFKPNKARLARYLEKKITKWYYNSDFNPNKGVLPLSLTLNMEIAQVMITGEAVQYLLEGYRASCSEDLEDKLSLPYMMTHTSNASGQTGHKSAKVQKLALVSPDYEELSSDDESWESVFFKTHQWPEDDFGYHSSASQSSKSEKEEPDHGITAEKCTLLELLETLPEFPAQKKVRTSQTHFDFSKAFQSNGRPSVDDPHSEVD